MFSNSLYAQPMGIDKYNDTNQKIHKDNSDKNKSLFLSHGVNSQICLNKMGINQFIRPSNEVLHKMNFLLYDNRKLLCLQSLFDSYR